MQTNVERNLKSGTTEAVVKLCENCTTTAAVTGADVGTVDTGTRVITIIEAVDELEAVGINNNNNNAIMNSNALYGGAADRRSKRGTEVASMVGNDTRSEAGADDEDPLADEMVRVTASDEPKSVPTKRGVDVGGFSDMTQAIMEPRADYEADEDFRAANAPIYDARRTRPVNNYRGYDGYGDSGRGADEVAADPDEHLEDADGDGDDDSDHNSHYEYVPMEFDEEGKHR